MAVLLFVRCLFLGLILFPFIHTANDSLVLQTKQFTDSSLLNDSSSSSIVMDTQSLSNKVDAISLSAFLSTNITNDRESNATETSTTTPVPGRQARAVTDFKPPINSRQFYCGETLKEVLKLLCNGDYNSPRKIGNNLLQSNFFV